MQIIEIFSMKRSTHLIFFYCICILLASCAGRGKTAGPPSFGLSLLSEDVKNEIRVVSKSVVGIHASINYEVFQYNYLQRNGNLVRDPNSPVGYKLDSGNGDSGVIVTTDHKTLSGGGLIINFNNAASKYTILTSNHLVSPEDTTDIYYLDDHGQPTDVLFARYVVDRVSITVRGESSWRSRADLIANDPVNDIAVIVTETETVLGQAFANKVGYDRDLDWGDWVFLFGYPKGIKQLTGGWISQAPYRNTLAVDAVVRFGYSGGPVFALSSDRAELQFVGLIKSVPSNTFEYIAPDGTLPVGYRLSYKEVERLFVKRKMMVEYGTAYFVRPQIIKKFFRLAEIVFEDNGIKLDSKYFDG